MPSNLNAETSRSGTERAARLKFRIAEAGLDLFLSEGFDNVTVDAVAAAAGVSRRTVFRHFATKDEIPFPDHDERQAMQRSYLAAASGAGNPLDVLAEAAKLVLSDFLRNRELVLKRYQLTKADSRVREREIIENDRYTRNARRFLATASLGGPSASADIIAGMFDTAHRSTLANWVRSGGTTDAVTELEEGLAWILGTLEPQRTSLGDRMQPLAVDELVLAVLPATGETYALIDRIRRLL